MEKLKVNREISNESSPISDDDLNSIMLVPDAINLPSTIKNEFNEELSEVEYNFCQRFIFSKDIADAMNFSGIDIANKKNWELLKEGRKIMNRPHVQAYLKELQVELQSKANIKKEDLINWLIDLKLRTEKSGNESVELKAIDTIGKALGIMAPKQIDYTNKLEISFGNFNPDDYNPENDVDDIEHDELI